MVRNKLANIIVSAGRKWQSGGLQLEVGRPIHRVVRLILNLYQGYADPAFLMLELSWL